MVILSKACKPDNFESHNSLNLSFTNIQGLFEFCWLWVFLWIKLSWYSCPMWAKPEWLNWFWQFHFEMLSSFNPKGFARDLSLENSADAYLCFWLVLLHSVSYFFFLYWSPSSLCMVFDSILSNIDDVLSDNPSANIFVCGDFNVHHKDWLTCSTGTDRSGELCYNFSISNDLTQMVNFPARIPDCDSHSPALLDWFLLTLAFVLQWLSLLWEILIMLSQFPLTFLNIHNRMPHFIA